MYDWPCTFEYYEADCNALSCLPQVDLLISQYACMVSQNMKQHLKSFWSRRDLRMLLPLWPIQTTNCLVHS